MSDHNQKALYFCHTHPNLFLQKKCTSCKRGMCHTCIYNNPNYCSDCLSKQKRFSSNYKDKKNILNSIVFAVIVSSLIAFLIFNQAQNTTDYPCIKYISISFLIALSVSNCYYLFQGTEILSEVKKVPFIGFKLSLLILILVVASGLPILYMLYKSILILKTTYFKQV